MTNFERIKKMSVEEMADIILSEIVEGVCSSAFSVYDSHKQRFLSRKEKIMYWLIKDGDEND